ncbi:MAG: phosphopantothenate/pantothenate synthetase [Candidatus Micrarchaeota archaeon]|nr:phosphopantothenate/pantothenate synthetase [Candidatus Micrarchaeota archaeon]
MNDPSSNIPKDHPRYLSLIQREVLVKGYELGIVNLNGLIAHGRAEAFDYLLGETTHKFALKATEAAVAKILLAKDPVFSVNGNVAVLIPELLKEFQDISKIKVEINLFHRSLMRIKKIKNYLEGYGIKVINKDDDSNTVDIRVIKSDRAIVCRDGIYSSDVVIVPLEDGDRTLALKHLHKFVIAIDLNPLSRTSISADITIVDNLQRFMVNLIQIYKRYKNKDQNYLYSLLNKYNNEKVLKAAENYLRRSRKLKVI